MIVLDFSGNSFEFLKALAKFDEEDNCLLVRGDAIPLLQLLPTRYVDLILTDPPYDPPDDNPEQTYMRGLSGIQKKVVAKQYARILKWTGSVFTFCGYTDMFKWYELFKMHGMIFCRHLVWCYSNCTSMRFTGVRRFKSAFDEILWFARSRDWYFDTSGNVELNWFNEPSFVGWRRSAEDNPEEKIGVTPKPLKILRTAVKRLSPKKGVVLDPFMGLGSSGIASLQLGRKFIGFEIRKDVFKLAVERIKRNFNSLENY